MPVDKLKIESLRLLKKLFLCLGIEALLNKFLGKQFHYLGSICFVCTAEIFSVRHLSKDASCLRLFFEDDGFEDVIDAALILH